MSEGALGILLAVGALGLLMNIRPREESVFIGAGITPATPQPKSWEHVYKPKPQGITPAPKKAGKSQRPATKADFEREQRENPRRPGESEDAQQRRILAANKAKRWARVSDIPPATRRVIVNTWITRARKIAVARLAALLNARRRSGYQTVSGYTGGMGGQIAPTVPGVTGAMGANAFKALEETMGLKPTGESKTSVEAKKTRDSANGAIEDFIKCGKNQTCRNTATLKFDTLIRQNTTAVANSLYQLRGRTDPTQAQV